MVIGQGNRLVVTFDAIDHHTNQAALPVLAGPRLRDGDVVNRLPETVVDLQPSPVGRQARRQAQPEKRFRDEPVYPAGRASVPAPAAAAGVRSIFSKPNYDGSITARLGCGPKSADYVPITDGWNYTMRLYKPRKEILGNRNCFQN